MSALPSAYGFLSRVAGPKHLLEALKLYGTYEWGQGSNPVILNWATECGLTGYSSDDIPWCGLFVAVVMRRAGRGAQVPAAPLWARNWHRFGVFCGGGPQLGDVMVFTRGSGGHVGLYVGEDESHYHILGGNQSDMVNIARLAKNRIFAMRRPAYVNKPLDVRRIRLSQTGAPVSTNEA
jgi:uncharacterized protein (TIGR02594 family)